MKVDLSAFTQMSPASKYANALTFRVMADDTIRLSGTLYNKMNTREVCVYVSGNGREIVLEECLPDREKACRVLKNGVIRVEEITSVLEKKKLPVPGRYIAVRDEAGLWLGTCDPDYRLPPPEISKPPRKPRTRGLDAMML